jgi:hypothetical protein
MIWFFERERSRLQYEIRRQSDGDDYELLIVWPDGREQIESYSECGSLAERSAHLENQLADEGWASPARGRRGVASAPRAASVSESSAPRRREA